MMRINWIEFKNLDTGLIINKTSFNKELTLFVGRSGAGKTQILEAISTFCNTATGGIIDTGHFKGAISFSIDNDDFEWNVYVAREDLDIISSVTKRINGERFFFSDSNEATSIIKSETLLCNGNTIFKRTSQKLVMNGQELPQISNDFSLIYQYRSNDLLRNVYDCMNGLYKSNKADHLFSWRIQYSFFKTMESELLKCKTEDEYREKFPTSISTPNKIYFLKKTNKNIGLYDILLKYYKNIFPDVDDFIFKLDRENRSMESYVRTNGSNIPYDSISAGMRKTISFLVDLLTISNNYVVLIDEIENGLGVNCLDEVYDLLTSLRTDLQLIMTSHHPYIINNVNPESCKIVDRKRNVISTYSAKELNLTNSHHDFYDLVMNKLQYGDIK